MRVSLNEIFRTSFSSFTELCKILIPTLLLLKLIEPFGVIEYIAHLLEGTMQWVGLPGYTAIVWASAILGNLYTGLIVLVALWDQEPLNVAQISTLCLMMLIAHGMIVEVYISHKSGSHAIFTIIWRFANAYLMGWLCYQLLDYFALFNHTSTLYLQPTDLSQSWLKWGITQLYTLAKIYFIILTLSTLMHVIKKADIEKYLHLALMPLLKMFNLRAQTANITLIGIVLGISYGGAFLIDDVQKKRISKKEGCIVFTILNLNHALVEDTILILLVGSTLWIVLLFRLIVGLLIAFIFCKIIHYFPSIQRWIVST